MACLVKRGCASMSCSGDSPAASFSKMSSTVMRVPATTGFPIMIDGLDSIKWCFICLTPASFGHGRMLRYSPPCTLYSACGLIETYSDWQGKSAGGTALAIPPTLLPQLILPRCQRDRLDHPLRSRRQVRHVLGSREDLQDVVVRITFGRNVARITNERMDVALAHCLVGVVRSL